MTLRRLARDLKRPQVLLNRGRKSPFISEVAVPVIAFHELEEMLLRNARRGICFMDESLLVRLTRTEQNAGNERRGRDLNPRSA